MRSANLKNATLLGLVASGALLAGCSGDASRDGVTPPLVAGNSSAVPAPIETPTTPASLPEPTPAPVDAAAARSAWKDGVAHFESGEYAAASDKLKTAVAGEPQNAYRHYVLGLARWKAGDLDSAEASLVESATLDATRPKTWINLARVRNQRQDRTGALEAAGRALELDSTSAAAMHQKGRALMELGRGEEALAILTSARGLDAGDGYLANTLGLLLIQLGKPTEAIEPLEAAKSVLPTVAFVRNNLGVAYERTGRLDEAKLEYLAAVKAGDTGGKAMASLARLGASDAVEPRNDSVATASVDPQ